MKIRPLNNYYDTPIKSEIDLGKCMMHAFSDFTIFNEVQTNKGITDMVIVIDNISISLELKMDFNWTLIKQGFNNINIFNYNYLVSLGRPTNELQKYNIAHFGLGVLSVYKSEIIELHSPKLYRIPSQYWRKYLKDFQKKNTPGVQNGRTTSFGHFKKELINILRNGGNGEDVAYIFKNINSDHYKYKSIEAFKSLIYSYGRIGLLPIRVVKGKVYLNDEHLFDQTLIKPN